VYVCLVPQREEAEEQEEAHPSQQQPAATQRPQCLSRYVTQEYVQGLMGR